MTFDVTLEEQNTEFDVDFDKTTIIEVENKHNPLEYARQVVYTSNAFPDGYELTIDMPNIINMQMLLWNTTGIKKATIKGNIKGNTLIFEYAFACDSLETLDLTDFILKVKNGNYMFYQAKKLREIKGNFDIRNCTSATDPFKGCVSLEEIRFLPLSVPYMLPIPDSPLLSAETRQSIVDALIKIDGVTGNLQLHPDVVAKFTEEQILEITNKNWVVQGVMSVESE